MTTMYPLAILPDGSSLRASTTPCTTIAECTKVLRQLAIEAVELPTFGFSLYVFVIDAAGCAVLQHVTLADITLPQSEKETPVPETPVAAPTVETPVAEKPVEQILVITREVMEEALGQFQGLKPTSESALTELLFLGKPAYHDRPVMEKDPSYKQLIPYVVVHESRPLHESRIFAYRRTPKGGESRLHGRRSIGVGGHINPFDGSPSDIVTYRAAVRRELFEEISGESAFVPIPVLAFLNDESDAVGEVHLGVVHTTVLANASCCEADAADDGYYTLAELLADIDSFENWSQLVLRHLAEARNVPTGA